jgi:hypothetical protein
LFAKLRRTSKEKPKEFARLGISSILSKFTPNYSACFKYLFRFTYLVYATTLFDTFLSDITRFLLLLHPGAIGENKPVPFGDILSSKSINQIVRNAVDAKVRDLASEGFFKRIAFLKDTFGIKVALAKQEEEALRHYSSLRNLTVHDQGCLKLLLTKKGVVEALTKKCPINPKPISYADVEMARKAYSVVVREIYTSVATKVLKVNSMPKAFDAFMCLPPKEPPEPCKEGDVP